MFRQRLVARHSTLFLSVSVCFCKLDNQHVPLRSFCNNKGTSLAIFNVVLVDMDFRWAWTLGGRGLQVNMDRGHIDFTSIQFYPRNIGGH